MYRQPERKMVLRYAQPTSDEFKKIVHKIVDGATRIDVVAWWISKETAELADASAADLLGLEDVSELTELHIFAQYGGRQRGTYILKGGILSCTMVGAVPCANGDVISARWSDVSRRTRLHPRVGQVMGWLGVIFATIIPLVVLRAHAWTLLLAEYVLLAVVASFVLRWGPFSVVDARRRPLLGAEGNRGWSSLLIPSLLALLASLFAFFSLIK